eukprot:Nitzschia sp. Nitz4//scaffold170_size48074//3431//3859//NITZ4_007099-RA/size48074-exonerate_protein2genome-gene-0.0-mRNA-1//1//CDS//3329538622//8850//frame0
MNEVDRVSSRVTGCALLGFVGGMIYSTYRGYPLRATSLRSGLSCAIVGTALFGAERLGYVAMKDLIVDNEQQLVLTSHAFSGVFGGGLNGYLYQKKPLRGMFFCVPLMLGVGAAELAWEQKKLEKQQEALEARSNNSSGPIQ